MTEQQAFSRVVRHLRAQGKKCVKGNEFATCLYRGSEGLKCGIGALVPDDQYKKKLELRCASDILDDVPALKGLGGDFLDDLQCIHDDQRPSDWDDFFKKFAIDRGLNLPVGRVKVQA